MRETYAAELLSTIDADAVRERRFRIVVDYGFSGASYVLPLVLGPLGVEVVSAHAFTGEGPDHADAAPGLAASIGQTKRLVPVVGADLGAVFDRAAERLHLSTSRRTRSRSSRRYCSSSACSARTAAAGSSHSP